MITAAAEESVLWLTISRPKAANALDAATHDALVAELDHASLDDGVAAVVLQAAGDRVFCAGADLKEFSQLAPAQAALKRRELLLRTLTAMLDFPKPLLAAVQAPALGAGAMLVLACDEILMADNAWLSFPEITLGLPSPMGAAMIAHRAHRQIVQRLVQLGQRLSARDALLAGLADQVAAPTDLTACCAARAGDCAAHSGHAHAVNKRWMNRELRRNLADAANAATADQHP